jgi:ubiquinone/menaquinone biosynthesis C-methylase UbiE
MNNKFDSKKLKKLNNPQRLIDIPPEFIASKLDLEHSGVLVEIGAGTAFFCIALAQQLNSEKVYASDISDAMISWIKENVTPVHPNIIPVKNQESSIPLDSDIADLVFMIALHHELEDPGQMLEETYRLLKPGGQILIIDWKKEDMPQGPPTEIRWLAEQVRDQLNQAGFDDIDIYNNLAQHFLIVGGKPA